MTLVWQPDILHLHKTVTIETKNKIIFLSLNIILILAAFHLVSHSFRCHCIQRVKVVKPE